MHFEDKAVGYLRKALNQDPKREKAWLALARIYHQKKAYRQAKACFKRDRLCFYESR